MVAFFFLAGCISVVFLTGGAWLWLTVAVGGLMIWLSRRCRPARFAGIAVVCFALGCLHAHGALDVPMPPEGTYEICGHVCGGSEMRSDDRIAFVLDGVSLNGVPVSGKAYCTLHYDEEPPELFDGALVSFTGRVYHPGGKTGAPHRDFRLWMRQKGYAFGVAAYQGMDISNTPREAPVCDLAYRIQLRLNAAYERVMGENGRIAMALLFGRRDALSDDEYQAFQKLGIAHIMSVSGLHVGLVGSMLLSVLNRLKIQKRFRLLCLCLFLAGYCFLTGFSASAIRAAVMLVCFYAARLCGRRSDRLTILAAAMLIVLLIDPLSALSAGFVLSFSAMLGIILCTQPLMRLFDRLWPPVHASSARRKLAKWQHSVKSLLAVTVSAQLGVLLPTMRYFHQLPLYGMLINLLIVPLVSGVLVPVYVVTLIVSAVPWLGPLAGTVASALTDVLLWLVQLLSRLPHAAIRTPAPSALVCIGLGLAGVILSRRCPGRFRTRLIASALTAAVALGAGYAQRPAELRYIQLAVGQEDSALLLDGRQTVLIDAGTDGMEAIDYLLDENRDIDTLILTHLHMDHIGGVPALLESGIRIRQICLPPNAALQQLDEEVLAIHQQLLESGIPITELAAGDTIMLERSAVRVLWPVRGRVRAGHDANDYSLALAIDLNGYTLLNAGDLSGSYEKYAAVPADVLKAAHHGSDDSTKEDFLQFVDPQYVLLSVSGSSRTLPGSELISRLEANSIPYFRTDECGDITITVQNGVLTITPYMERKSP